MMATLALKELMLFLKLCIHLQQTKFLENVSGKISRLAEISGSFIEEVLILDILFAASAGISQTAN